MDSNEDFKKIGDALREYSGFDFGTFEKLKEDTNELVALKILARFRMTLNECLADIKSYEQNQNIENVWKPLHKIAGTAELVGLNKLGQQSRQLSHLIRNVTDLSLHETDLENYLLEATETLGQLDGFQDEFKTYL